MDHSGINVHKRESQIHALAEGGRSSSSTRMLIEASTDSECGPMSRGARPRGAWADVGFAPGTSPIE
jgi:hypothetical protein